MNFHAPPTAPKKDDSLFAKVTGSPVFPLALNAALFIAGVAFIQSPLMDAMAPQL